MQISVFCHNSQNLCKNIIHSISKWFVGSSNISKSTSCSRNFAIWTLVCSHHESCEIFRFNWSFVNQKYFKISVCNQYFWYQSLFIIRWISSFCSSTSSIEFSGSDFSNSFISSNLFAFAVMSGNAVSISSFNNLSLLSQKISWDINHILIHFGISSNHWSMFSFQISTFKSVDFHAQFFQIKAISSQYLIFNSAVFPSCLLNHVSLRM